MKLSRKIRELRQGIELNQTEFGRLMGVSQDSVSGYEKGRVRPPDEFLAQLSKRFKIAFDELTRMRALESCVQAYETSGKLSVQGPLRIPIYSNEASAGLETIEGNDQMEGFLVLSDETLIAGLPGNSQHLAMVRVRGDSMTPTIDPGEFLVVDTSEIEISVDGLYVLRLDGALIVKRLQRLFTGEFNVISDNPAYPPIRVSSKNPPEEFRIAGRVVGLVGMRKA